MRDTSNRVLLANLLDHHSGGFLNHIQALIDVGNAFTNRIHTPTEVLRLALFFLHEGIANFQHLRAFGTHTWRLYLRLGRRCCQEGLLCGLD